MLSLFYERWCWQPQGLESAWRLISELNTAWLSCVTRGGGNVFVVVLLVWVADGVCTLDGTHRCIVHDFVVCYGILWRRVSTFNIVWRLCGFYLIALLNVLCSSWTDIRFCVDVKRVWRSSMASMWPSGVSIRLWVNVPEESTRRF